MEKRRFKVADFASEIGSSPKTVYALIENEELITETENFKGREIKVIVSDLEQINTLRQRYGKLPVNENKNTVNEVYCEENVTVNEGKNPQSQITSDILSGVIEKVINQSNTLTEQLLKYQEELITYKSKIPLLEDKADREGTYLNEISELKKVNETQMKVNNKIIKGLISVIIVLFIFLVATAAALVYKLNKPTIIEKTNTIETIKEVEKPVVKYKYVKK